MDAVTGHLAVVVPVGPREDPGLLTDTLDSIAVYTRPGTRVLVVNDGARPAIRGVCAAAGVPVAVMDVPGIGQGVLGGLTRCTTRGLRAAVGAPDVDLVLRLDTDALFTGPGLEQSARALLATDPGLGLLGSHTLLSTGARRDFGPAAFVLGEDLGSGRFRHPVWALTLRRALRAARRNGYVDGEHVLAAASVFTRECITRLDRARLLPPAGVRSSALPDDQYLGLAVRAVGLRMGDLASGDGPLALAWRGLPDSPERLLAAGKAVVHSVKSWQDQDGDVVRAEFRQRREIDRRLS